MLQALVGFLLGLLPTLLEQHLEEHLILLDSDERES